jgi:hypothetical protein
MTRALILPAVGLAVLGALWLVLTSRLGWSEVAIADASRSTVLKIRAEPGKGNVVTLGIRGSGFVEGKSRITLILNDRPEKSADLSGEVSFEWVSDWYSPEAEIRYESSGARGGQLRIQYNFGAL